MIGQGHAMIFGRVSQYYPAVFQDYFSRSQTMEKAPQDCFSFAQIIGWLSPIMESLSGYYFSRS